MDDLTVTTPAHMQTWVLVQLDHMATWAKTRKSRSLEIRKGKTTERFELLVQGEVITNIQGNPVKSGSCTMIPCKTRLASATPGSKLKSG